MIPILAISWYVLMTAITLAAFAIDKLAAVRGGSGRGHVSRVPERTLHIMSLLGGAAGALAGRRLFRHKTLHSSFLIVPVIAIALHAAAWIVWAIV